MKVLFYILFFVCATSTGFAQSPAIDSLIKQLSNKAIIDDGDYFGAKITLSGEAVNGLLKIGKPASNQLISILDDSTKGIISHCVLTWIWGKGERPKTFYIEKDKIVIYIYNNLCFFRNTEGVYTNQNYLTQNKIEWSIFLRQQNK